MGWDVQYFGTVEPQKRGAPHFHAAIRGAIPRTELRAITTATYHQVWWPAHNQLIYTGERLPAWNTRAKEFTDPDTGTPLPTWEQACAELTEPTHVVGGTDLGSASAPKRMSKASSAAPKKPDDTSATSRNTYPKASAKPPDSTNTPPTPNAITPTD